MSKVSKGLIRLLSHCGGGGGFGWRFSIHSRCHRRRRLWMIHYAGAAAV